MQSTVTTASLNNLHIKGYKYNFCILLFLLFLWMCLLLWWRWWWWWWWCCCSGGGDGGGVSVLHLVTLSVYTASLIVERNMSMEILLDDNWLTRRTPYSSTTSFTKAPTWMTQVSKPVPRSETQACVVLVTSVFFVLRTLYIYVMCWKIFLLCVRYDWLFIKNLMLPDCNWHTWLIFFEDHNQSDIVGTVYHLVIYMQSNKIHSDFDE